MIINNESIGEDILSGLNEAQKNAVTTRTNSCLILAGPGSGKTHTITARIRYLIHQRNIDPESILVITFTKDAALSMRERFYESEGINLPVVFGTFHSVFYSILRESGNFSSKKLLSDSYKKSIIQNIISKMIKDNKDYADENPEEMIPELICAVSIYKNTGDLPRLAGNNINREELFKEFFKEFFKLYENNRIENNLIDFDDMVYDCKKLLSEREIRNKWQKRFKHILIDEYQDTNQIQFDTLNLLKGKDTCIFAVGDDDQSIYGFRGAKPSCLRTFKDKYNAELIELNTNYRSAPCIIKDAHLVISENTDRFEKKQSSGRIFKEEDAKDDRYSKQKSFCDKTEEYTYITKMAKEYIEKGSCAVLFRTNLLMQDFASFLTKEHVKYVIKEKNLCIYDHPAALDLFAYLETVDDMYSDSIFKIINKPVRYIARNALTFGENTLPPIKKAINYYHLHSNEYNSKKRIQDLCSLERDLLFIKDKSLFLKINLIRKKIGLEKFYAGNFKNNKNVLSEYLQVLDFLAKESTGFDNLEDWYLFINEYKEEYAKKDETSDTDIRLMTIHASKGLEFDSCIIPGVNEGIYPHGIMPDRMTTEEERRIFYVGMTRAKDRLLITYIDGKDGRKNRPSMFLNKLIEKAPD